MNTLSIASAYGVMVAVFQWGWGAGVLGIEPAPIEAWMPMMMFAIVFGLSMDYEVFLLTLISCDSIRAAMTDILIRGVPDDVLAAIDARARRLGLSRTEYLRRALEREHVPASGTTTVEHLQRLATLAQDLDDRDVMSGAWS